MLESVVVPLLGAALLVLLATDVFLTIFHPRGRGGAVQARLSHGTWGAFRWAGRRLGEPSRSKLLSFGGPAIVLLVLAAWLLVLVLGFALIYYPWMEDFLVSPGTLRSRWGEALYYSGYTAVTLGTGDLIADHEPLRLLAPVQAFGGFALLSASVTYLLSVYRELMALEQTAAAIHGYHRIGALEELGERESGDAAARWAERLDRNLLHLLQAYHQYPVLHYFRPESPARSLPVQLGRLLHVRAAVRKADEPPEEGRGSDTAFPPSVRSLVDSVEAYVAEVDDEFVRVVAEAESPPPGADRVERAHRRLLRYMAYPPVPESLS